MEVRQRPLTKAQKRKISQAIKYGKAMEWGKTQTMNFIAKQFKNILINRHFDENTYEDILCQFSIHKYKY